MTDSSILKLFNCSVADGLYAIEAHNNSSINIDKVTFDNNYVGIYVPPLMSNQALEKRWITFFGGDGSGDRSTGISISGPDMFIVGISDNDNILLPVINPDENNLEIYYQPVPGDNFGFLTKYSLSELVGVETDIYTDGFGVSICPNPATTNCFVELKLDMNTAHKPLVIEIHNVLGQLVQSRKFDYFTQSTLEIDVSSLQKGTFFLSVGIGKETAIVKLIVQ